MAAKIALAVSIVMFILSVAFTGYSAVNHQEVSLVFTGEVPRPYSPSPQVYVSGEVVSPGVYQLPAGSRVEDALQAAGGFTKNADPKAIAENLNLAAAVEDGTHLQVPSMAPQTAPISSPEGSINVNSATAETLDGLPGIGPSTAAQIVSHRPYQKAEDLLNVPGIGPSKLAQITNLISF